MAITKISDVIVPSVFDPYFRQQSAEKFRLVRSGAVQRSPELEEKLRAGGNTFDAPSWQDLDPTDADDVMSDNDGSSATPSKLATSQEIVVRMARHKSWSAMGLAGSLAGDDPVAVAVDRSSDYWSRRFERIFVAAMEGVFADNAANDSGDYTQDISSSGNYSLGSTTFNASAVIDAMGTMGEAWDSLALIMMHSVVFQRAQKENLIDFVQDAQAQVMIPTYMGREVVVSDRLPVSGGSNNVYSTWFFGRGAVQFGAIEPPDPNTPGTEIDREPAKGDGSGQTTVHTRWHLAMHPRGHAFTGTTSGGGPTNASTSGNLANADAWNRVYAERNQIPIAELKTTEHT